jgi:hypothetical protein
MSSYTSRKASAGLASGFLSVTALFFLLAALGIGPPETVSKKAPHTQIGTGR